MARRERADMAPPGRRGDEGPLSAALPKLGTGRPLDGAVASRLGAELGHSFARVRIHDGGAAAELAAAERATAVTMGTDIAFAPGAYAPGNPVGDALLAHELAHVAQQDGETGSADERTAESAADRAALAAITRPGSGAAAGENRVRSGLQLRRCPNYSPDELATWEAKLDREGKTATGFYDDDQARQLVQLWVSRGANTPMLELTPRRKTLLIRTLLYGEAFAGDQEAILELLERSPEGDLQMMFSPPLSLTVAEIRTEMSGDHLKRFESFVLSRLFNEGAVEEGLAGVRPTHAVDVGDPLPGVGGARGGTTRRTGVPSDVEIDKMIADEYGSQITSKDNAAGTLGGSLDLWAKHTTKETSRPAASFLPKNPDEKQRLEAVASASESFQRTCMNVFFPGTTGKDETEGLAFCKREESISRAVYVRTDTTSPEGRSIIHGDAPGRTHVHEALHAYTHPAFTAGATRLIEGATEYFAQKLLIKHKMSGHGPSYEEQRTLIQEIVIVLGSDIPLQQAYFGGRMGALAAAYDAKRGAGAFAAVLAATSVAAAITLVTG